MTTRVQAGHNRPALKSLTTMKQVLMLVMLLLANAAEAQIKRVVDVKEGEALETLLGEDKLDIDTLVVTGSLKHTDFPVMRQCLYDGKLRVIDISECTVEDDSLPDKAFAKYRDPAQLDSIALPKTLRAIGSDAFYRANITGIDIPATLRIIGRTAFAQCYKLKSVDIPEGVEVLAGQCFRECDNLEYVSLPSTIKYIGQATFTVCKKLKKIELHEGIEFIGRSAFESMGQIEEIVIPGSVRSIGEYAFYSNQFLQTVTLPDRLAVIMGYTFEDCTALCNVEWPSELEMIFQEAFKSCGFTTLALPGKIEAIGNEAFADNTRLTKLLLPESLESIGNAAFAGCENLKEVYCQRMTPPDVQFIHSMANPGSDDTNIPLSPFDGIADDAVLYVPIGTKSLYEASKFAKGFAEIRETADFPSAINDETTAQAGCRVTAGKGCISISTNNGPMQYKVCTAGGLLVAEGEANGTDIVKAPAGICIVSTIGGKTKVVVR